MIKATTGEDNTQTFVGCGQALLDQKIVIVNPDTLAQCSADEVGEVWVSSPSVARGYWNRPEETQDTFEAYLSDTGEGPFLRTGDLGFMQDGELFITGRLKDMIIIRGHNHYPQDIELTVEQSHPALEADAGAAFSVDVDGEERLMIIHEVARRYIRHLDVYTIVKTICQAVAENHELQTYAVVLIKTGSIPKTSSGKIQRHACRADFLAGDLPALGQWTQAAADDQTPVPFDQEGQDMPGVADGQPASTRQSPGVRAIEAWLVEQVAKRLKVAAQSVDVREPLSRYGLDSLEAANIAFE